MPEVFFSLGATELSGEVESRSGERKTSTTRSDAPRRWRTRRPLASRVTWRLPFDQKFPQRVISVNNYLFEGPLIRSNFLYRIVTSNFRDMRN